MRTTLVVVVVVARAIALALRALLRAGASGTIAHQLLASITKLFDKTKSNPPAANTRSKEYEKHL